MAQSRAREDSTPPKGAGNQRTLAARPFFFSNFVPQRFEL